MAIAPTPSPAPFYTRPVDYASGERLLDAALAAEAETRAGWEPLDGETRLLRDRPADFGTPAGATAFPAGFRHWHTAHQLEWVKARTADNHTATVPDGTPNGRNVATRALSMTIQGTGEELHVVLTNGQRGVAVLNDMTARQLRGLRPDDQHLVAAHRGFAETIARFAGLRPSAADYPVPPTADRAADARRAVDTARAAIKAPIEFARDLINARETGPNAKPLPDAPGVEKPGRLTLAAFDALLARLDRMAVFDEVAIADAFAGLQARDARLERYGRLYEATPSPTTGFTAPDSARSPDGDAAIRSTYELFAAGEKRLAFLIERTAEVTAVSTAGTAVRALDAGGLVYAFQLYENHEREVEAEAETEQVRQRNELLAAYAEVQRLVNASSAAVPPPKESKDGVVTPLKGALVSGTRPDPNDPSKTVGIAPTREQLRVVAMFDSHTADPHPVEVELDLFRPVADLLDGSGNPTIERTKAQWDLLSASLAAAVRVLDRDVQTMSNAVNATSRERTRHFDLATDTLNRMSGMVQTIGRGIN